MSKRTALYRYWSVDDDLLYVGISTNPFRRMSDHAVGQLDAISNITIEWFDSREEAEQLEALAIQTERPFYNMKNEVINFSEWSLYAFCNKQWPYNDEIERERRRYLLGCIRKGCAARGWPA